MRKKEQCQNDESKTGPENSRKDRDDTFCTLASWRISNQLLHITEWKANNLQFISCIY